MYALMIKPEYVADILEGTKTEEYRSWSTDYRGDLLIGCSSTRYSNAYLAALVDLTDCYYDRANEVYVWQLDNIRAIKPLPITGKLRIFETNVQPHDIVVLNTEKETIAAYDNADEWIIKKREVKKNAGKSSSNKN